MMQVGLAVCTSLNNLSVPILLIPSSFSHASLFICRNSSMVPATKVSRYWATLTNRASPLGPDTSSLRLRVLVNVNTRCALQGKRGEMSYGDVMWDPWQLVMELTKPLTFLLPTCHNDAGTYLFQDAKVVPETSSGSPLSATCCFSSLIVRGTTTSTPSMSPHILKHAFIWVIPPLAKYMRSKQLVGWYCPCLTLMPTGLVFI